MIYMISFWAQCREELFNIKSLFFIGVIAFIYISIPIYFINYRFLFSTIFGAYPITYKLNVLFFLFEGLVSAFSPFDSTILIITGILVGLNAVLMVRTVKQVQKNGSSLKLLVGGGGILGLVSTGCASCGFSVLSIFGLGASISFLPFGGKSLYILSVIPLAYSAIYMLKKLSDSNSCRILVNTNNLSPVRQTRARERVK